jgi:hypothetical protein
MRSLESVTASSEREISPTRRRGPLGRLAIRATAIASSLTATLAFTTATEIATAEEARADSGLGYHITGAEKAWCRWPSRWSLCNRANELAAEALTKAEAAAAEKGWNIADGGADAVRHCYWNGRMTQEFGVDTAAGFGWRHEYDDTQTPAQYNMDVHNNQKGRDWASDPNIYNRCLTGVEQGELIRLAP